MKTYLSIFTLLICFCSFGQNDSIIKENSSNKKKHLHISPYDFSFKKELPFILTSAGVIIGSEIIKHNDATKPYTEEELLDLDRNDINSFDRPTTNKYNVNAAKVSDVIRTATAVFPALFLANHNTKEDIAGLVLLTVEVTAINYGFTNSVKHVVNRTRPFVYNDDVDVNIRTNDQSRISFFSGHTSHTAAISFMCAKVINDYHPDMKFSDKALLWGGASVIPAVTAYLRVQSGNHFPTDVIAGYFIGAGVGWLVPHLHKRKYNLALTPYSSGEARGISLFYNF